MQKLSKTKYKKLLGKTLRKVTALSNKGRREWIPTLS